MKTVSFAFMIVSCVLMGWLIVPLAWLIPMTIAAKKSIGDGQSHVALGVCMLFFAGLIPGILMLCAGSKD